MAVVRSPAVAGRFYPAEPSRLRTMIGSFLDEAQNEAQAPEARVRGLIEPHAGYRYSGRVAASGYVLLRRAAARYERVVLIGTAHTGVEGIATTAAQAFDGPLGTVAVDQMACRQVEKWPGVHRDERAHRVDHALEVQLPFLSVVLESFRIVPLLVGKVAPEVMAEILAALWDGADSLVVVSSDLSHYQDDATARMLDEETARAIVSMEEERVGPEQACGHHAIAGFLKAARRRGLVGKLLDLRNSGQMGGSKAEVVGYGTFAFLETSKEEARKPGMDECGARAGARLSH